MKLMISNYSRYSNYTRRYKERVRYMSEIPLKNGNSLLLTPKPPFAKFRTPEEYMHGMYAKGVETIVVFLESREEKGLISKYEEAGFNVIHFPIKDFNVPSSMSHLSETLKEIRRALAKHSVAMHCFGGNGRTGLVAASLFVQVGMPADKAIQTVRKYRPEAIETSEQEKFIHDFEFFERYVK